MWNTFIETDPYDTRLQISREGNGGIWVVQATPIPEQFPLILGEILYQYRAALDGAVQVAAVIETGQDPPPNESDLAFPIMSSAGKFKNAERQIKPLSDKSKSLIEALQPYNAPALDPGSESRTAIEV